MTTKRPMAGNQESLSYGRANKTLMPTEGDDGLYTQSWFPMCLSAELKPGEVLGRDFLGGRVVVVRGANGDVSVMSAYCPHVGADLSVGDVCGNNIRCAFHHWQYDLQGNCVETGSGDRAPSHARLFRFPTRERFGLVWAFNGVEPLFDLPDFDLPDEELEFLAEDNMELGIDPWVAMANTLDLQHLKVLHHFEFHHNDPDQEIEWGPYSVLYDLRALRASVDAELAYRLGIVGSNIFYFSGELDGRLFAGLAPARVVSPGKAHFYMVCAAEKGKPSDRRNVKEFLRYGMEFRRKVFSEDMEILKTIRFAQNYLTKSDKALGKFLNHIRVFPRSHPSADYIT